MAGGGNSGSGTTTQEIPAWLQEAYQSNLGRANALADKPYEAYQGQLTAGDNADLSDARFLARQGVTSGMDATTAATNNLTSLSQKTPSWFVQPGQVNSFERVNPALAGVERANASTVAGSNLSAYTNPYEDQVVGQALDDIDLQRQRSINQSNADTPRGAFGGSRQGVSDSLTNEAYGRQAASTASSLRQAGYDRATGLAGSDADRLNQTSQFNAGSANAINSQNADRLNAGQVYNSQADYGLNRANADALQGAATQNQNYTLNSDAQRLAANQSLLGAGQQQQQMAFSGAQALGAAGQQLQGTQQAGLDAQYGQYERAQNWPLQMQQLLNQSTLGINAGGTTTTNSKSKGYSL